MGHVTTEEAAEMIQLAAEGRTQREIAEETGRNLRTVNKTIRAAMEQIAEYKAADYWQILAKYHDSLEAIASRACDEYLGVTTGQADPRNAAAAIAAIREDAKNLTIIRICGKSPSSSRRTPAPTHNQDQEIFPKSRQSRTERGRREQRKRRLISKHKQERSKRKRNEGLKNPTGNQDHQSRTCNI